MRDYRNDPGALNVPWVHSPFFEDLLAGQDLDPESERLVRHYHREGFVVLPAGFVSESAMARARSELEGRYLDKATGYDQSSRASGAWRFRPAVREIACAPKVLALLQLLYQRPAIPFQTLNFEYGTEQRTHSDSLHFHSVPNGFMCGVWLALEEIGSEAGPLHYYPGSHRLPWFDMHDIGLPTGFEHYRAYEDFVEQLMESQKLERVELPLRRGEAVIWSANLFHGGSEIRDPDATRYSQVTHYYFEGCSYYQPGASDPFVGRMALKDVVDLRTAERVPNLYRGQRVRGLRLRPKKSAAQWLAAVKRRLRRNGAAT